MVSIFKSDQIDELVFLTLQLIDGATLFSKEEVIKEYTNNKDDENIDSLLYKKAVYPNGEQLGFYNTSKYSLNDFYGDELSEIEWTEYLNGFSSEIKDLFNILFEGHFIPLDKLKRHDIKLLEKKEDINDFYLDYVGNLLDYEGEYVNYQDLSNYFINVLFEGIEFKEKTSILHIGAENTFIISCLNHIKNKNPQCDVELYVITGNKHLAFSLNFLAIINKTELTHVIYFSRRTHYGGYSQLFDQQKNFDFVIQTDSNFGQMSKAREVKSKRRGKSNLKRRIPPSNLKRNNESRLKDIIKGNYIPDYGVTISSRSIYIVETQRIEFYKDWLEHDLLESIIMIPYKYDRYERNHNPFKFVFLIVLNNNKPKERQNKFLLIDNNENKVISRKEYNIEDYNELIDNKNIYRDSYYAFSNFKDSAHSKLFNLQDFSNKKYVYFNDEMYDIKMKTQKKYYKTEHFKGNERIIKTLNYKKEKLGSLISRVNGNHGKIVSNKYFLHILRKDDYVVNGQWTFLNHEIMNVEPYHGFRLISDKVSLEFLYYFLNSQVGNNEYNYFARGQRHSLPIDWINDIRVPIPPKNIQDKIVEAMSERDDFLNDVNLLKSRTDTNFFDYKQNKQVVDEFYGKREYSNETQEILMPDNWIYTYGGLVWPLAITYLIATSGGFEKVEKANNLLKLFEFTAAFNTIVLISGLPEEIYENKKHKIWKKAYDYESEDGLVDFYKLSFGSWVTFHYKLKSIFKKRFNTEINREFFTKLLNNNIIEYYKTLKDHRNNEFHDGITNSYEAESLIKELNIPKTKVFNYLNECYKNFRLFYITGKNDDSTNEHEIIFLNGPYSMPIYSTIQHKGSLEAEALYLYDEQEKKFCKLNSKLIKFMALDEDKHDWRLYIFIGFEKDDEGNKKAKYKCYQRKEDDIDVYFDLKELL